jgi:endoglycosylceramidase
MPPSRILCFSLLFSVLWGHAQSARAAPLHATGKYIRDAQNAVVVLRGFNVAGDSKVPNFRPLDDPKLLAAFPDWGVNVARLLFIWEAYEPQQGSYDAGYLDYYVGLLDALDALDVRVIVDFHQDAFSRFTLAGCGEGMPEWTIPADITKAKPANDASCAMWGVQMFTDNLLKGDMARCWAGFYANQKPNGSQIGVREAFLAMIGRVAARVGAHPAVIGYDILNEPVGDEKMDLAPLYTDGAKALRAQDPDALLFVSPQAFTSSGPDTQLPAMTFGNYVYSPHYYDAGLVINHSWDGTLPSNAVNQMVARAASWDVPVFIGEFGGPASATNVSGYVDAFYNELNSGLLSAAQWTFAAHWDPVKKDGWNVEDFSVVDDQQRTRLNFRVRPYIARVPGTPTLHTLSEKPYDIRVEWMHDPSAGVLRIFAPKQSVFTTGAFVEVDGDVACAYESNERYIRCEAGNEGMKAVHVRACEAGDACLQTSPASGMSSAGADPNAQDVDAGEPSASPAAGRGGVEAPMHVVPSQAANVAGSANGQAASAGAPATQPNVSAAGDAGAAVGGKATQPETKPRSRGCGVMPGRSNTPLGWVAWLGLLCGWRRRSHAPARSMKR